MDNFLSLIDSRKPVVKDGNVYLPGTGYAVKDKEGKFHFSDPMSEKVESDDAQMRHRFRISTPAVDRAGDIVLPEGCKNYLDRYRKNPQVFLNHASFGLPIAMSKSPTGELGVLVREDGLFADAFFHGKTEESEKVYELIKLGYLQAASIGFRPIKAALLPDTRKEEKRGILDFEFPGLQFLEWELLEWSVVGVPCNHEALDGMKSWLGKNTAQDSALHMALKAMLVEDSSQTVGLNLPVDPPKEEKKEEVPVMEKIDPLAPITPEEVEQVITNLKTALVTEPPLKKFAEITIETPEVKTPEEIETLQKELQEAKEKIASLESLIQELPTKKDLEALIPPPAQGNQAKDDALPVPAEPAGDPEEAPKKIAPLGAVVLLKILKFLDDAYHHVECKISGVDNPKTVSFLEEKMDEFQICMKEIKKFGKKQYPDWFSEESKEESPEVVKTQEPSVPTPVPAAPSADWSRVISQLGSLAASLEEQNKIFYQLTGKRITSPK